MLEGTNEWMGLVTEETLDEPAFDPHAKAQTRSVKEVCKELRKPGLFAPVFGNVPVQPHDMADVAVLVLF